MQEWYYYMEEKEILYKVEKELIRHVCTIFAGTRINDKIKIRKNCPPS
jgi:hypothetical protein